jgi:hypothetical protein
MVRAIKDVAHEVVRDRCAPPVASHACAYRSFGIVRAGLAKTLAAKAAERIK